LLYISYGGEGESIYIERSPIAKMKLVNRTTLLCQEGSSDKVYEVDLCQVEGDKYLVNFRYGRRGSNLKEGTKTTEAVNLKAAEQVFEKLVASKVKGGYHEVTSEETPQPKKSLNPPNPAARQQAILKCITDGGTSKWPLERAIWRAGELKIAEATPLLIPLLGKGNELRDYCLAAALGNCGGKGAIPALISLYQNSRTPDFVSRIAFEGLLKLSDLETRSQLQAETIELLPKELQATANNGSAADFASNLSKYLETDDYKRFAVLDDLYRIDNQYTRPALLGILRTAPLRPNYFQRMRHIFKMAEYRQDAEVFGILTYRLETEDAMFDSDRYYIRLPNGTWVSKYKYEYNNETGQYRNWENPEYKNAMSAPDAKLGYSNQTRNYLRRRIWRTLKGLAKERDPQFINLASQILLQYSDADAQPARQSTFTRWENQGSGWRSVSYHRNWDTFARFHLLYHILYENSDRYHLKHNSKAWCCVEPYKPGDAEPEAREEAFPELWEAHPESLLKLLLESNCRPVHNFAVKAIRCCRDFCDRLDLATSIDLLKKPYEATSKFGFELAREKYNPAELNLELVLAALNSSYEGARHQSYEWIKPHESYFLQESNFIATLITNEYADNRLFARELLVYHEWTDDNATKVLIGRLIAIIMGLESSQTALAQEIGETLLVSFRPQLANLGLSVILDLLGHPLATIQELGAQLLLNHQTPAVELPTELIESLIDSKYEPIRLIGIRIFGQLPDDVLEQRYELILSMVTHKLTSIRQEIRPVIKRLGANYPEFARRMTGDLLSCLRRKEKVEGWHQDIVIVLENDIPDWMSQATKSQVMQLIESNSVNAQELGAKLLSDRSSTWSTDFEISDLIKLASHELFAVRELARNIFSGKLDIIRTNSEEMKVAVRLLESKWEDTQNFAKETFKTQFQLAEWTPEVLISICDSVKEDVRQFGRDLVLRTFQESYGQEYLIKLSEHPSTDMQLFVTNYLEAYASGDTAKIEELRSYFISVLSAVNKCGVAKKRVFKFLQKEASKSEASARLIAEIMARQALTICIGDRAQIIQTLHQIQQKYPHISLPILVKPVTLTR
jgi:predicted DNA-binding WGR domain protein